MVAMRSGRRTITQLDVGRRGGGITGAEKARDADCGSADVAPRVSEAEEGPPPRRDLEDVRSGGDGGSSLSTRIVSATASYSLSSTSAAAGRSEPTPSSAVAASPPRWQCCTMAASAGARQRTCRAGTVPLPPAPASKSTVMVSSPGARRITRSRSPRLQAWHVVQTCVRPCATVCTCVHVCKRVQTCANVCKSKITCLLGRTFSDKLPKERGDARCAI
jgi:hypothetical protein